MSSYQQRRKRPTDRAAMAIAAATAAVVAYAIIALVSGSDSQLAKPGDAGPPPGLGLTPKPTPRLVDRPGGGPLSLSGNVVDASGAPVAEVSVTAEFELGPGVRSLKTQPGIALAAAVVAVTSTDGVFVLQGLERGRYRLRVEGEGIVTAEVRFIDVPGEGVRVVVARQVAVHGRVMTESVPARGVEVRLVGDSGSGTLETSTDENGQFAFEGLSEGVFRVWAYVGDQAAPAVRVDRLGPGPFENVELVLGPAFIVKGRVVDLESGRGVAAYVTLSHEDGVEPARLARSGPDGLFEIPGILAGRWSAEGSATGYVAAEAVTFAVGNGYSPTLTLTRGGSMAGVVVDGRGVAVKGALVSVVGTDLSGQRHEYNEWNALGRGVSRPVVGGLLPGQRFIPRGELGVLLGPIPMPPPPGSTMVRVAMPVDVATAEANDALPVSPALEGRYITDARGSFVITGLAAGRFQARATHPDFADGISVQTKITLGKRADGVRIVVLPGMVVAGVVRDGRGSPLIGAIVTSGGKGNNVVHSITGTDGRYSLGPFAGDVELTASATGYGAVTKKVSSGKLRANRIEKVVDFALAAADRRIEGRVVDPGGFAVRGARVLVESKKLGVKLRSGTTDDGGRFTIEGLPAGSYRVRVEHRDFPALTKGEASTDSRAELLIAFGGGIDAQVRDAHTGSVVAGVQIQARGPEGDSREAVSDEKGVFKLVPLTSGKWTLSLELAGYVAHSQTVEVPAGDKARAITVRDLRIRVERGATIAGTVRDRDGERIHGAIVKVGSASAVTDESGAFRMNDVPTGDVTITLERGKLRGSQRVTLAPGEERITLELRFD